MPAFLTHYAMGLKGYRSLKDPGPETGSSPSALKNILHDHNRAYAIGLAGPDLFFYSVFELLRPGMTIGRIMHKYRTGAFLQALFDTALKKTGEEQQIALAYFTGFMGHYCLDMATHPLVYRICRADNNLKALGRHFRYEAAMDEMCCRHILGRSIGESGQMAMIRISPKERRVISDVLSAACKQTYPEEKGALAPARLRAILREYYAISGLLIDPSGFREWCLQWAEKRVLGYVLASPLFINDNHYSLKEKDWERFQVRFERGEKRFTVLLAALNEVLSSEMCPSEGETALNSAANSNLNTMMNTAVDASEKNIKASSGAKKVGRGDFFKMLESRSYHTGIEDESIVKEKMW